MRRCPASAPRRHAVDRGERAQAERLEVRRRERRRRRARCAPACRRPRRRTRRRPARRRRPTSRRRPGAPAGPARSLNGVPSACSRCTATPTAAPRDAPGRSGSPHRSHDPYVPALDPARGLGPRRAGSRAALPRPRCSRDRSSVLCERSAKPASSTNDTSSAVGVGALVGDLLPQVRSLLGQRTPHALDHLPRRSSGSAPSPAPRRARGCEVKYTSRRCSFVTGCRSAWWRRSRDRAAPGRPGRRRRPRADAWRTSGGACGA